VKETADPEHVLFTARSLSETHALSSQVDVAQQQSTPYIQTKLQVDPLDAAMVTEGRETNFATTNFLDYKGAWNGSGSATQYTSSMAGSGRTIQRQPASGLQTPVPGITSQIRFRPEGVISRQEFDQYVQTYFGVSDVHTGTQIEQEQRLTRHGVPTPTIPNWQSWDPGTASEDYTSIIDGVEEMLIAFGAMPQVRTIIFFKLHYQAALAYRSRPPGLLSAPAN
jgi:hypothetical protein